MKLFHRHAVVPATLRQQLPGHPAHGVHFPETNQWLVATPQVLALCEGELIQESYGWEQVQQITWNQESDTLAIHWPDPSRKPLELHKPAADGISSFGVSARNYLNKSQVYTHFARVPSGTQVRIAVRVRSQSNERFSEVVAFGVLSTTDQIYLDRLESEIRDSLGMPG